MSDTATTPIIRAKDLRPEMGAILAAIPTDLLADLLSVEIAVRLTVGGDMPDNPFAKGAAEASSDLLRSLRRAAASAEEVAS